MITQEDERRALEMRERDARARAIAVSCAAYALNSGGDDVHPDCRHYARDCAELAATLTVSALYLNDAELRALKEENERLREMALQFTLTSSPKLVIPR